MHQPQMQNNSTKNTTINHFGETTKTDLTAGSAQREQR